MAQQVAGIKISELREIARANPDDFLVINDTSQVTTKKISVGDLFANAGDIVTDNLTFESLTGPTFFDDITITSFVTDGFGIQFNDNNTSIPTSAAVKDYVDGAVSDYRAKTILSDTEDSLSLVNQLKVYQTKYNNEDEVFDAVIAHEVEELFPYVVMGEKDAVYEDGRPKYQKVNYAKLVPALIVAIQELSAKVDELENSIRG